MSLSYLGFAQELTSPQVEGHVTGSTIRVSFPFGIKGVPFSQIPGSVWHPFSRVIAELQISYYMEGDEVMYVNKLVKSVNPQQRVGSWDLPDLKIEPKPYPRPNTKVVEGRTTYILSVYQIYNGKNSKMWYANIVRDNRLLQLKKIPDQSKGPVKVYPKDKLILNPQPIPPMTKKIKTSGL